MKKTLVVASMLLLVLAGCSERERSVTGLSGSSTIAGQVYLAGDLAGGTPAGIQVSVRGVGVGSETDANGRFAIFGAPASDVELAFSRGDGIAATYAISDVHAASNLQLDLTKNSAHSRRRGLDRRDEIEGIVTAASATSVTIHDSHGQDVTVKVDDNTVIRKGQTPVAAADLTPGTRVHAKGTKADDGSLTASEIIVQNEDNGQDAVVEVEGIITAASATSITVHDSHGQDVVVAIDTTTVIRKGQTPVAAAELAPGMRVHVKAARATDGTLTAVEVIVQNDENHSGLEIEGLITAASATSITVHDSHGMDDVIAIDPATIIRKGQTPVDAAALTVGTRVHVKVTRAGDGTLTATEVIVQDDSESSDGQEVELEGTVKSVGTDSLVVTTETGDVTVQVSSATKIRRRSATLTLSQIVAGDRVGVDGTKVDDTTVLARMISVR